MLVNFVLMNAVPAQNTPVPIPARPLDAESSVLRSYVEFAAGNSWGMDLQDILVNRAEAFALRSDAARKPSVTMNADLGYQMSDAFGPTTEGLNYRFNLSARKSLYSWGAVEAERRFGLFEVKRVKHDRQLAFLSIYRDVVFRYIDLEISRQRMLAESIALNIQKDDLELRRSEVERGEFPETQFATIELNYNRAALRKQQLDMASRKAEDAFRKAIGTSEPNPLGSDKGLPAVPTDLLGLENQIKLFLKTLGENSIKVLSKNARLDQELERLKRYEVNQRPKVNGLLRFRRDTEDFTTGTITDRNISESFAGFEFNWNIYDGRSTSSLIAETLESRRQLERELEILRRDIKNNLEFLLDELSLQKRQVEFAETSFGWQAGEFSQIEKDVKAGRLPQKDLEAAKGNLESERVKQMEARAVFYKTLTELYVALEHPTILAYLEE